mmetsp:Transcript_5208/g.10974  ORF Transcript_5208/g.10974 Transcript_5208/m.10974 type:complete len:237 (-) Transcript_5208:380-1090(-)
MPAEPLGSNRFHGVQRGPPHTGHAAPYRCKRTQRIRESPGRDCRHPGQLRLRPKIRGDGLRGEIRRHRPPLLPVRTRQRGARHWRRHRRLRTRLQNQAHHERPHRLLRGDLHLRRPGHPRPGGRQVAGPAGLLHPADRDGRQRDGPGAHQAVHRVRERRAPLHHHRGGGRGGFHGHAGDRRHGAGPGHRAVRAHERVLLQPGGADGGDARRGTDAAGAVFYEQRHPADETGGPRRR